MIITFITLMFIMVICSVIGVGIVVFSLFYVDNINKPLGYSIFAVVLMVAFGVMSICFKGLTGFLLM